MSDTYDEMESFVEATQRKGGQVNHSRDEDHPQQDFGRFSKMGEERLSECSPEHYEEAGDEGDEFKRELPEREILRP